MRADGLIPAEPDGDLVTAFRRGRGAGKPKFGQSPISCHPDEGVAGERARKRWRCGAGGWKVNAELPDPESSDAYSATVTADDVCSAVSRGPDVETHVKAVKEDADAGCTHVALVAVGADRQSEFISWPEKGLLPALRPCDALA